MRTYDISLTLSADLPIWPGDDKFVLERVGKIEEGEDENLSKVVMSVHMGTHVDAPYHYLNDSKITVEQLPLKVLTGRVYVLQVANSVDVITTDVLANADIPPRTRRLLFKTRNSEYWAEHLDRFQTRFVGISEDGANYLVDRGVKLVGIDYLSVAPYEQSRPTHELLLRAGVVIVEGLDLSQVSQGRYTLYCLPLKLAGADGAPARAILVGV